MEPKAVRQGYEPPPFFFAQTNDSGDSRLVAWAPSLAALRRAFEALIKALPASVEVLLKIKADNEGDPSEEARDQVWERYHGVVAQGALLEAMARCHEFVFQDSRNQICVRDPVSFDHVVLDEVGVVYVYSDAVMFRQVFARLGFEERIEPLVSEEPYWTQTPKGGREQQTNSCGFCDCRQCRDLMNLEPPVRSISALPPNTQLEPRPLSCAIMSPRRAAQLHR